MAPHESNVSSLPFISSSGVKFYPAKQRGLWKIGRKWYDLTPFLDKHPGGRAILELSRDRFEDSTYAFESFHPNQPKVRAMLEKYIIDSSKHHESSPQKNCKSTQVRRSKRSAAHVANERFGGKTLELMEGPELSKLDGFYGELRERVHKMLEKHGGKGPTQECIALYFSTLAVWVGLNIYVLYSGCHRGYDAYGILIIITHILSAAILGGFGHNWVHQIGYRDWATYSLDLCGFSSENWFREHLLQHHIYTNSELDNHFQGTEPFLAADPRKPRKLLHKVSTIIFPFILLFGVIGNWVNVIGGVFKGEERWRMSMATQPVLGAVFVYRFGFNNDALYPWLVSGCMSVWYFTVALMNHNTDYALKYSFCKDWGEIQLSKCSDIGTGLNFLQSWRYLWLNYHTVHHLFPTTDMSKHPAIQVILLEVAEKHGVKYYCPSFAEALYQTVINLWRPLRSQCEVD